MRRPTEYNKWNNASAVSQYETGSVCYSLRKVSMESSKWGQCKGCNCARFPSMKSHFYKCLFKTPEYIMVILPTSMCYITILPDKNTGIYGRDQEEKEINFIPFQALNTVHPHAIRQVGM